MGSITDNVKRILPDAYQKLCVATNAYGYTQGDLQALADFVKFRLSRTVSGFDYVAEATEAGAYDLGQIELMSKMTALQFIPAAINYYGTLLESKAATGTSEVATYFDQRTFLWKMFEQLSLEVKAETIDLFGASAWLPQVSYGDDGRGILLTPDPMTFEKEFGSRFIDNLPSWQVSG